MAYIKTSDLRNNSWKQKLWLCGAGSQVHNHSQHNQCRTPYAVIHGLVLLTMGIMMPETCWDRSLIINIWLVASYSFLSLHPTCMMQGQKSLKLVVTSYRRFETTYWSLKMASVCCPETQSSSNLETPQPIPQQRIFNCMLWWDSFNQKNEAGA